MSRYDNEITKDFNKLLKKISKSYAYAYKNDTFREDFDDVAMRILFSHLASHFENNDDDLSYKFSEVCDLLNATDFRDID